MHFNILCLRYESKSETQVNDNLIFACCKYMMNEHFASPIEISIKYIFLINNNNNNKKTQNAARYDTTFAWSSTTP